MPEPHTYRTPPKRRKSYAVKSFKDLTGACLHVRGLRGETFADAKVFRFSITDVNAAGSIASGSIADGGEQLPCTVRLCEVKARRRSRKRKPIGVAQIGEHGDRPSLMLPWIGEHLLESVSVAR